METDCCGARVLPPFGEPFDMGDPVCANCGQKVNKDGTVVE